MQWPKHKFGTWILLAIPLGISVFGLLGAVREAHATDYTSSSFILRDPTLTIFGGSSTSTSFQLFSSGDTTDIGENTSTSFITRAGFLYFPIVTTPVVTATAGANQVSLSWTSAVGSLGWVVSGYNVGQATVSGGPYTYTSVGNVVSSARTGLTSGATYYFVIRPEDAFGNSLATSSEVSATPTAASPPPPAGGGGGGGGGPITPTGGYGATGAIFSGLAYPGANVTLLKDGTVVGTTPANTAGNFSFSVTNLTPGVFSFSLFAEDQKGIKSVALSFSVTVVSGITSNVGNIIIPPTISLDRTELSRGDFLNVNGYAAASSRVDSITFSNEIVQTVTSTAAGVWQTKIDTSSLEDGFHVTKAKTTITDGTASTFSSVKAFSIGRGFPKTRGQCQGADFNLDGRVNLIDFSIMLFYWRNLNPVNPCVDINADGIVDLIDFSILLFQWTG